MIVINEDAGSARRDRLLCHADGVPERAAEREKGDTADRIAALCRDLARMARGERFGTLVYLLDMACLEAEAVGQQYKPNRSTDVRSLNAR